MGKGAHLAAEKFCGGEEGHAAQEDLVREELLELVVLVHQRPKASSQVAIVPLHQQRCVEERRGRKLKTSPRLPRRCRLSQFPFCCISLELNVLPG